MAAITWRNVDAPSLGDPSRSLLAAQQGIQGAFTTLGDVLKGYQDNQAKNWDITKANNTEDFYAKASSLFPNAEAFKAALASGQLNEMAKAHGAQIDQAGVRQFMDSRQGVLQDRALVENKYNDAQQELRLRPQVNAIKMLAVNGKTDDVHKALQANPEILGRYGAELVQQGILSQQQLEQHTWAADRAAEAKLKAPLDRAHLEAQTGLTVGQTKDLVAAAADRRTQAGAAATNAAAHATQVNLALQQAQEQRVTEQVAALTKIGANRVSHPEGMKLLVDELRAATKDDPVAFRSLMQQANQISKEYPDAEVSKMLPALLGDLSTGLFNRKVSTGTNKDALENFKAMPASSDLQVNQDAAKALITQRILEARGQLNRLGPIGYVGSAGANGGAASVPAAAPVKPTAAAIPGGPVADVAQPTTAPTPASGVVPGSKESTVIQDANTALSSATSNLTAARAQQEAADAVVAKFGLVQRSKDPIGFAAAQKAAKDAAVVTDQAKAEVEARQYYRGAKNNEANGRTVEQLIAASNGDLSKNTAVAPSYRAGALEQKTIPNTSTTGEAKGKAPPLAPTPLMPEPAKASATSSFKVDLSGKGAHKDTSPLQLPTGLEMTQPTIAVQAKPAFAFRSTGEKAVVTYVEDADTARLKRRDGSSLTCRFDKIDAPETAHVNRETGKAYPAQQYGDAAKRTLQDMIENKEVTVTVVKSASTDPKDPNHGRSVCQIEIQGTNVNLELVKQGAAWAYRRFGGADKEYVAAEVDAKVNKRGLWALPNPQNPELFRRLTRN